MPTTPIPPPTDPTQSRDATDQASSDTGWASATGAVTIRRPVPLDTDSSADGTAFTEEPGADGPSLATL